MTMLSILFVLTVITICVYFAWPAMQDWAKIPSPHPTPAALPQNGGSRAVQPESLEGVLVAQLMAGEITRSQYLKAAEGIAARDDERHPLAVPPEIGPANA